MRSASSTTTMYPPITSLGISSSKSAQDVLLTKCHPFTLASSFARATDASYSPSTRITAAPRAAMASARPGLTCA